MAIILDPHKGFCRVDQSIKNESISTYGFEKLDWESQFPDLALPVAETPLSLSPTKRAKAKLNRKLRKKQPSPPDQHLTYSSAKKRMQTIYRNLSRDANDDSKLFQFELVPFYKSDLEFVLPGEWFNDNHIAFVYEAIQVFFLKKHAFGFQIQLLLPSLVQLFLHFPGDDLENMLLKKDLAKAKYVFIPFNFIDEYEDIDMEDANNGDHWALCVLDVPAKQLLVYDSMSSDDDDDSLLLELSKKLGQFIYNRSEAVQLVKMKCDQQQNFDDCGVFLLMITCLLISRLISGQAVTLEIPEVRFEAISGRLAVMELIEKMHTRIAEAKGE